MKKISLLVALILCVTVGGVYATWNYAHNTATAQTKYLDASTIITDKVESLSKGTIKVDTSNLKITVDDSNNDYYAELKIEGNIKVDFTASAGATDEVANNGIKMQYVLGTTDNFKYNGNNIFTIDSTAQKQTDATKSFTIEASELTNLISLYVDGDGKTVKLPTADDYILFKQALHSGSISITVSEVTE